MAEWSEDTVLELLSYYEQNKLLWTAKHQGHFNKILRNEAWTVISKETGKPLEDYKKDITYLLATIRREKAKMKSVLELENVSTNS